MRDLDEHQQAAFDLLTSRQVREAFDISREPDKLRDRYGRHTFGQSALLARRLVEDGVTFVTVNCVPWDHHGSPGQYKTEEGARLLIPPLDRAIAALVEDLIDRGLYEKTLVVAMGEFGRTPRMNNDAGRDHWGNTFSVLMGCGGMQMGQVIGRSSPRGEHVVDRPISPAGRRRDGLSPPRHRRPRRHVPRRPRPPTAACRLTASRFANWWVSSSKTDLCSPAVVVEPLATCPQASSCTTSFRAGSSRVPAAVSRSIVSRRAASSHLRLVQANLPSKYSCDAPSSSYQRNCPLAPE